MMVWTLLLRIFAHHRGLLVSLCFGLAGIEWLLVWIAATIDAGPGIRSLLEQVLPPEIRTLFSSQLGMMSVSGMVGFGFQHPMVLVAAISFIIVVCTLPAGERESGFLDLILARPVPRHRFFLSVVALFILGAVLLPLALFAGAALGLSQINVPNEIHWTRYARPAGGLMALLLAVGGYTLLFAAGAQRRGTAASRAIAVTLTLYWIDLMADLWEPAASVRWLSPFYYYDPIPAALIPYTPVSHPVVLLTVFLIGTALATYRFGKRDL
jgi:ABC-2 type transport system permease protein